MHQLLCLVITVTCILAHGGGPFQSTKLVEDKTVATLDENIKDSFYQSISKRSGLIISPETNPFPINPKTMVERYDYTKTSCAGEDEANEQNCYNLTIYFNPDAINTLMQDNNIDIWDGDRPSTLIWLQRQTTMGRITLDAYNDVAQKIMQQAHSRDITVLFPTGDITDQQVMTDEPQITGLEFLLSKYQAQQILYGMVVHNHPLKISWHLFSNMQNHDWESTTTNLDEALSGAIDHIVNTAKINKEKHSKDDIQKTIIEIKNLSNYDEYSKLSNHLLNYEPISKTDIINIGANFFTIEITHEGPSNRLLQALRNDKYLQSSIDSPNTDQALSSYQWTPPEN